MINPLGSVNFLMKWSCWGHWGHGGCWNHWGHWDCRGFKAWKITWGLQSHAGSWIQLYFDFLKKYFLGVESWNIRLNFSTFSVRSCWGQPMLLFWKLSNKTQMSKPCDHAAKDMPSKFSIFLSLRAIYFRSYQYETPCT